MKNSIANECVTKLPKLRACGARARRHARGRVPRSCGDCRAAPNRGGKFIFRRLLLTARYVRPVFAAISASDSLPRSSFSSCSVHAPFSGVQRVGILRPFRRPTLASQTASLKPFNFNASAPAWDAFRWASRLPGVRNFPVPSMNTARHRHTAVEPTPKWYMIAAADSVRMARSNVSSTRRPDPLPFPSATRHRGQGIGPSCIVVTITSASR
jgi:hypothetical protein